MGITFYGATPDSPYPTTIYNQEYDGFADIPQYPLNLISDLNAFLGFQYVHPTYRDLTQQQIDNAKNLGTYGTTTYYMIPTENLPLLIPLRAIPVIGNPVADLLQPDLRVLVDLGYGSVDQGWSSGPPNVETPFGLFPKVPLGDIVSALVAGAKQVSRTLLMTSRTRSRRRRRANPRRQARRPAPPRQRAASSPTWSTPCRPWPRWATRRCCPSRTSATRC